MIVNEEQYNPHSICFEIQKAPLFFGSLVLVLQFVRGDRPLSVHKDNLGMIDLENLHLDSK